LKTSIKILIIVTIFSKYICASSLDDNCLNCHNHQKIPSQLIYKKYLIEYSSKKIIKRRMMKYLLNPRLDISIMPQQFFLKFPMKDRLDITKEELEMDVDKFIDKFGLKIRID
jgi:hypothetical protein